MKKSEIATAKAMVKEAFPSAKRLQYHQAGDTISGEGCQLTRPIHARGEIDKYGNARFTLAELRTYTGWELCY